MAIEWPDIASQVPFINMRRCSRPVRRDIFATEKAEVRVKSQSANTQVFTSIAMSLSQY